MEFVEDDDKRTPEEESIIKTESAEEEVGSETPTIDICEKEFGRLKLEKEQRKREEEDRRIEQLQAQEKSRANKKKKKSKQNDICDSSTDANPDDNQQKIKPASTGQPLKELSTSTTKTEGEGRGAEKKNDPVTNEKPKDKTKSMKGKEGESGQAPTSMPGMINHPNSSATEMHGFRSPTSPVPFENPRAVYESYLRAQDEEFDKLNKPMSAEMSASLFAVLRKEAPSPKYMRNDQTFKPIHGTTNHSNSSATETHGVATPEGPVEFANSRAALEKIIRAQDEEFDKLSKPLSAEATASLIAIIRKEAPSPKYMRNDVHQSKTVRAQDEEFNKPRPKEGEKYSEIVKRPSRGMSVDGVFRRKAPLSKNTSFTPRHPTILDGRGHNKAPVPLQHTCVKPETIRPTPVVAVPVPTYQIAAANLIKQVSYPGAEPGANSQYSIKDYGPLSDMALSQSKGPPGLTKAKVPQDIGAPRCDLNCIYQAKYYQRSIGHGSMMSNVPANIFSNAQAYMPLSMTSSMTDYRRCASLDSRCSSLASPVVGVCPHGMMFGAYGTRPSSEASFTSDRPSSGLDFLCNNIGYNPYASRVTGYPSTNILNKRASVAMTSPFTPAWQNDGYQTFTAMAGMMNPPYSSATEMPGLWSSTRASPVAFGNGNSAFENYLRAQDEEFMIIKPQRSEMYPQMAKRTFSSYEMGADGLFTRKSPLSDFKPITTSNVSPQSNQGSIPFNGPPTRNIGHKPLCNHVHQPPVDQWTTWNAQRLSPDGNAALAAAAAFYSSVPVLPVNDTDPWESWRSARTVNPSGPTGSNLNRMSSNAASNATHGKRAETDVTDEDPLKHLFE